MFPDQRPLDNALDPGLERVRISISPHPPELVRVGCEPGHRRRVREEPMSERSEQAASNVPAPERRLLIGRADGLHVGGQGRDEQPRQPADPGERATNSHPVVQAFGDQTDVRVPVVGRSRVEPAPQGTQVHPLRSPVATDLEPAVPDLGVEMAGGSDLERHQVELGPVPIDGK